MTAYTVSPIHVSRNEFYALPALSYRDHRVLAANTVETFSVPTNATFVSFAATADIYVSYLPTNYDADIVTNGTFAADTSWTKGAGWTIAAGVADAAGAISTSLTQTPTYLLEGQAYSCVFTATRAAGSITLNIGGTAGTARSSSATFTETIIAGSGTTIGFDTSGFTGTVDNFTVTPIAIVPTADTIVGRGVDLNPTQRMLNGVSKISMVSESNCKVTMNFYRE
jgi:hypothetical protein